MNTILNNNTDYLKFIHDLDETISGQNILLTYNGNISHDVTLAFSELAEKYLFAENKKNNLPERVHIVMIECLQNISKYAYIENKGKVKPPGKGIFLVSHSDNGYRIMTGNVIENDKVGKLKSHLDKINSMNKDELKTLKSKQLLETELTEKGGAGIGLIEIARRTDQKIAYDFIPKGDNTSFFLLVVNIN